MSSISVAGRVGWRTPAVVVGCGCLIALLSFGPRSALGQFLTPLSVSGGWGRDVFSFAIAVQNLLWGMGQPLAGGLADRFGAPRVLSIGAALYALGLVMMAYSTSLAVLDGQLRREQVDTFEREHGMPGYVPTQGHIPAALPYLAHARAAMRAGRMRRAMFVAKGSLFLGKMTNLADGMSVLVEAPDVPSPSGRGRG